MAARAAQLGDVGESAPENWERPLGTADVHVAISVLAPDVTGRKRSRRARVAPPILPASVIWRRAPHCQPIRYLVGFKDSMSSSMNSTMSHTNLTHPTPWRHTLSWLPVAHACTQAHTRCVDQDTLWFCRSLTHS